MTSLLITGGSGSLGTDVVDACVLQGDTVTVIDKVLPQEERKNPRAQYVQADILADDALRELVERVRPDCIVHLAAQTSIESAIQDPENDAEQNILGTIKVLEAMKDASAKRLIYTSTSSVYGEQEQPLPPENTAPRPHTPFAVSKLTAEQYIRSAQVQQGISACIFRIAHGANRDDIVRALVASCHDEVEGIRNLEMRGVASEK